MRAPYVTVGEFCIAALLMLVLLPFLPLDAQNRPMTQAPGAAIPGPLHTPYTAAMNSTSLGYLTSIDVPSAGAAKTRAVGFVLPAADAGLLVANYQAGVQGRIQTFTLTIIVANAVGVGSRTYIYGRSWVYRVDQPAPGLAHIEVLYETLQMG
jgi:hypothetical protein